LAERLICLQEVYVFGRRECKAKGLYRRCNGNRLLCSKRVPRLLPFDEDSGFDLVVDRNGKLERLQVKYTQSRDGCVLASCRSPKNNQQISVNWARDFVEF
jgi:hypothetical protein